MRVHPRERGEAPWTAAPRRGATGPSPRARGSPAATAHRAAAAGSIPASAGKPPDRLTAAPAGRVHPRERGEAYQAAIQRYDAAGPSPRARGSQDGGGPSGGRRGSIPASAGKPSCCRSA